MTDNRKTGKALRLLLVSLLCAIAAWLGYAVLGLSLSHVGLGQLVGANLEASGVSHPVTAVLLNFRGYDTLLEMGVLLVALLGVWSLGGMPDYDESSPGPVLDILSRLLIPMLMLVAGYLLWVGAHAPGGAFQAGSVLGAAGVLMMLAGWRLDSRFAGLLLRVVMVSGLGVFVMVSTAMLLIGNGFLEFSPPMAGELILLIEAVATMSIGATLAALFLGSRPAVGPDK
ncbi:MnhB domain-containing protein [Neptunomonas qingdaonensis]|uniref:Domain related to MnhB subunit of Na+/H+ antiporter n=1 Tax=Neptunomonas qingdaonensis TaxID=1045558 RepID=A0A1I2LRT4_9GAMM|nr:MnhB domain-containing protein [Neptunomonas qingdaonensis]SFF82004.1 Domain related to MnhB subunit of Na+/H+ antiporter [Neptunomonas qingdaonensis]